MTEKEKLTESLINLLNETYKYNNKANGYIDDETGNSIYIGHDYMTDQPDLIGKWITKDQDGNNKYFTWVADVDNIQDAPFKTFKDMKIRCSDITHNKAFTLPEIPDEVQQKFIEAINAYAEKINNNIWMLNVNNADKELKRMFELWNFNNIQNNTKSYKYGYLNYYNRRMFCNFMQGRGTEDDYKMALLKSNELGLIEYEGFAHMDYAKSIYNIDMYRAFGLLNMAKDIFEKSNEPRRLLDSLSEIAFTKALLEKDYSIIMLQNIGDKMKEQKYIHSYTRNCLKIIVIMLLSQKYTQTELLNLMNKMLMKNTAIASGKRHQAIAYHVLAAIYYFYNDIIQANKYSEKCLQLFSELGEDYKKIQFHNAEIKRKGKIILACENPLFDSDNFILDTRIW